MAKQLEPIVCTPDKIVINGQEQGKPTSFDEIVGSKPKLHEENDEYPVDTPFEGYDPETALQNQGITGEQAYDHQREYGETLRSCSLTCRVFVQNNDGPLSNDAKMLLTRLRNAVKRELEKDFGDALEIKEIVPYRPGSHKEFNVIIHGQSQEDLAEKLGIESPSALSSTAWLHDKITAISEHLARPIGVHDNRASNTGFQMD